MKESDYQEYLDFKEFLEVRRKADSEQIGKKAMKIAWPSPTEQDTLDYGNVEPPSRWVTDPFYDSLEEY